MVEFLYPTISSVPNRRLSVTMRKYPAAVEQSAIAEAVHVRWVMMYQEFQQHFARIHHFCRAREYRMS